MTGVATATAPLSAVRHCYWPDATPAASIHHAQGHVPTPDCVAPKRCTVVPRSGVVGHLGPSSIAMLSMAHDSYPRGHVMAWVRLSS